MAEHEIMTDAIIFLDQLVIEDVKTLCDMTVETGFFSNDEVLIVEELAWSFITEGAESDYSFLLAAPGCAQHDRPFAFACFGPIPCTNGSWELYWIVVDQHSQGCGFGRRLNNEMERRIRAMGGRKIFLETSSRTQYLSTRGFYEACGYQMESRLVDYYEQGEDCLVYSKILKRP
ncbi:MAG: GNAT family N-acetyltransferase [Pseudodesulfovibrio sp.]|nr:GNAT family N-acetyltransferase [Pseudodesulfovibrio sp.]